MATRVNDGRLNKITYLLHLQNLLLDARISEISRTLCRVRAYFVPNFVLIATRVSRSKILLAAFAGPSPTSPYKRKNLADISHTSRVIANFCPKFRCHSNGGPWGENAIGSIQWPIPEHSPHRRNNLADISYTDRVVANFVPNFVAMATREGLE